MNDRFRNLGLWSILLFILSIALICFFYRPAADDWFFVSQARDLGILNTAKAWYLHYGGRWLSYGLEATAFSIPGGDHMVSTFLLLNILFFFYTLFRLIKSIFPERKFMAVPLATLLLFTVPGSPEFYFWLSSSVIHLLATSLTLLLLSLHLSKRSPWFIFFVSVFLAGTSELLGLTYLCFLIYLSLTDKAFRIPSLLFGLLLCLNIFSPGSQSRFDALNQNADLAGMAKGFLLSLGALSKTFWLGIPLAFILGRMYGSSNVTISLSTQHRMVLYAVFGILILTLPVIVFQDLPPDRVLAPFAIFLLIGTFIESSTISGKRGFPGERVLPLLSSLLLITLSLYFLPLHFHYAEACDVRKTEILQYTGLDTMVVAPLPPSGLLYSSEITKNAGHFLNRHYRSGLGIRPPLRVGDQK